MANWRLSKRKMEKVTIVVTRYAETNDLVIPCLEALSKQERCNCNVLFLDQKEDNEIKNPCRELSNKNVKIIYKKIPPISLSYARELGTKIARTYLVLFTDVDAIPDRYWAYQLTKTLNSNDEIGVVGGKSLPLWLTKPKWYHNSNIVQEIYSLIDLSDEVKETGKIVGVNFGLNKKKLKFKKYFNQNLGRKPGSLIGGEETDLCKRVIQHDFKVYYTPFAIVQHQIQKDRMSLLWIMRRFYYGGLGKSKIGGMPKTYSQKRNIYDKFILGIIAIPYILGYLRGKLEK